MGATLIGLGTAVPEHSIDQQLAATHAMTRCCSTTDHARLLPALYRRTRVSRRSSVLLEGSDDLDNPYPFFPPALTAEDLGPSTDERMRRYARDIGPLAARAASAALADAGILASDVSHLVTVSCTGFSAPGFDVGLIRSLGMPPTTQRTHVGFMGCHGALNGLRSAGMIARAEPDAVVLMVAAELCSIHFRYGWDTEKVVANALFADGAGAAVVVGDHRLARMPGGKASHLGLAAHGACIFPDTEDAMAWNIGDHGFEMSLSSRVPSLIEDNLRPWMEAWLRQHHMGITDIATWAIHPGGPRIITSSLKALGQPESSAAISQAVLAEHGNMSSATLLFILHRLRASNAPRPMVALGFGPGLAAEAALIL